MCQGHNSKLCSRLGLVDGAVPRPRSSVGSKPVHLLVDSTGLRLCGPSKWLTETHGARARRSWKKLQLGVDADTGRIVAAESTGKDADDGARVGPSLGTPGGTVDLRTGALGGRGRMT
jgi:hypothetical protein